MAISVAASASILVSDPFCQPSCHSGWGEGEGLCKGLQGLGEYTGPVMDPKNLGSEAVMLVRT